MKLHIIVLSVMCLLVFADACGQGVVRPQRGNLIETWETANKTFKIRVTEYDERNPVVLPKYSFVFESAVNDSNHWREVMIDQTDNSIPIPKEKVQFLNDKTAYVFLKSAFAATVDGGDTWTVWDAKKNVPDWQCCNQTFIREVSISPDGKGTMALAPRFNDIKVKELHTKDYGITWTPANP